MNGYSDQLMLLNERGSSPTFPFTGFKSEQNVWSTDLSLFPSLGASDYYDPIYETLDAAGSANTYMNLAPVETTPLLPHNVTESEGLNYNYKPTFFKMDSDSNANVRDSGIDSPPSTCQSGTPPMETVTEMERLDLSDPVHESGNSNTNDSGTLETGPSSPIFDGGVAPVPPFERQCVKCGCYVNLEFFWKNAQGHMFCQTCYESQANIPLEKMPSKRKKRTASRRAAGDISCSNCRTRVTTLWRRTNSGEKVCNPCGLYKKLHNRNRPLNLNKNTIQRRNRTKTGPRQENVVTKQKNGRGKQKNITCDAGANSSQLILRSSSSQQICHSPPSQLVSLQSIHQPIQEQPIPQHMLPPPPPYHYYTADVNNGCQFLPPLESIPYYNNQEIHFPRFQGNNIQ